ncbi:MAG: hypothetical protein WC299_00955 [Kiritimatiellia bacterium]
MKKALLLAFAAALLAAAPLLSQENTTAMDRAKRIMAIRAAAKRVIDDSSSFLDAPQTRADIRDKMIAFMKSDVGAHKRRDASRKLCLEYAQRSIQDILVSNVVLAVAEASARSPLPITVSNVLANVDSNWTGSAEQAAAGFTARHFEPVFAEAREKAVAGQRMEIEKKVSYPPYPDLNAGLSARAGTQKQLARADFEAIGKWWAGKDSAKFKPVYDEVQEALDASVYKNIGNEVAIQYESQRILCRSACSNRADLARYLTADGIRGRIAALCRAGMPKAGKHHNGAPAAPVYDLFGPVEADITETSRKMEGEYFLEHIRALASIPVSERDLGRDILAELPAHKGARQSGEILARKYSGALAGRAASDYVMRPGTESSARNAEAVKRFTDLLAETNTAAAAWNECVAKSIAGPLKTARADIARRQFEKAFPRLEKTETLPDPLLDALADKRNFAPFKSVDEMREFLPDFAPAAGETGGLIEETGALALDKANRLCAAAALAARGQELCLRDMEKEKIAQLEADVAARKPLEKISAEWSGDLAGRWLNQAKKTGSPYEELLGRTRGLLDKTVRQLYDSRLAAAAKKSARDDSSRPAAMVKQDEKTRKSQEPSGGGAAENEAAKRKTRGETSADLFIIIRDLGRDECEALLETSDGSVLARTSFDPARVESADEKIFSSMRGAIRGQIASRQTVTRGALFGLLPSRRSGLKDLGVYIVSQSVRVRLKTSLLIREKIEALIEEWAREAAGTAPKLRWGAGFSSDELKDR